MAKLTPDEIVQRGEEIYNEKYREEFEKKHHDSFIVIDIDTAKIYRGMTPEKAFVTARTHAPDGTFCLLKVGSPTAFRMGPIGSYAHIRSL